MNVQRDPDAILAAWLEEGPNALPEPTRRAIAVNTRTINQRRHLMWMPRRSPTMKPFARSRRRPSSVIAVLGGAVYLLAPGSGVGGGPPASTVPVATPAPPAGHPPSSGVRGAGSDRYGGVEDLHIDSLCLHHRLPGRLDARRQRSRLGVPADATYWPATGQRRLPFADGPTSAYRSGQCALTPGTSTRRVDPAYCRSWSPTSALHRSRTEPCGEHGWPCRQSRPVRRRHTGLHRWSATGCTWSRAGESEFDRVHALRGRHRLVEGFLSTMRLLPGAGQPDILGDAAADPDDGCPLSPGTPPARAR